MSWRRASSRRDKIYVRTFVFVRVVKQGGVRGRQRSSTFAFTREIPNKVYGPFCLSSRIRYSFLHRKKTPHFKPPIFHFLQFLAIDTSSGVDEFLLGRRKSLCLRMKVRTVRNIQLASRHCFAKNLDLDFCSASGELAQHVGGVK